MRVKVAKSAGFCTGVKRAVNLALETSKTTQGPIYTHGPLVHNRQALEMLRSKGIRDVEALDGLAKGTVIIRAHGIPPEDQDEIEDKDFNVVDATCPHIVASRRLIQKHLAQECQIILVGDEGHPEMMGLLGYAGEEGMLVSTPDKARALSGIDKACVIAQTTFEEDAYDEIAEILGSRIRDCRIFRTVCSATRTRQDEARALAEEVDAMVVVGGKQSANTRRLFEIAIASGKPAFCIETGDELDMEEMARFETVGVTAGASTPHWVIRDTVEVLRSCDKGRGRGREVQTTLAWHLAIDTNLFLGIGAAFLSYACSTIQHLPSSVSFSLVSFLYVLGVHLLNRLSEVAREGFDEPSRTLFLERHARTLRPLAWVASAAALVVAWAIGLGPFLLVFLCTLGGILYRFPFWPGPGGKRRPLSDFPASKDLALSAAWASVTALLPPLTEHADFDRSSWVAVFFAFTMTFVRSTLQDVKDIQGDKIVGTEMLPVVLGKSRTKALLALVSLVQLAVLAMSSSFGWTSGVSLWLILTVLYAGGYLWLYHMRLLSPRLLCGLVADANFVLAGLVALAWQMHSAQVGMGFTIGP